MASDAGLINQIIQIRQQTRLKLPDAIIAATALQSTASLITADQEFSKLTTLTIAKW